MSQLLGLVASVHPCRAGWSESNPAVASDRL